jgi:RNA polymerase sigma-70 factor (ECF subfamily)
LTDEQILEEIKSGNDSIFRELILRYESQVARYVKSMLGNCPEADDVGQEVFIRFYNSIDKFRGESTVGTYLTRIAINLSLSELKRRKRRNLFFTRQSEEGPDIPDINANNGYDDEKEIIRQAIQKLEPKFRSVIVLRLYDGFSTEETAKILKIPIGTVFSRLARAQKKMKEILSPYILGAL